MIIPLPFIVSLLFTITYATEFEYKIDLERCTVDMRCYIRSSCFTTSTAASDATVLAEFKEDVDKLNDFDNEKSCDVVLQIKALAQSKYLVLMQIKKSQTDLDHAKGIVIKQNGENQIDCKDGALIGNSKLKFVRKGVSSNIFDATKMFCSFTMETTEVDGDAGLRLVSYYFGGRTFEFPLLIYYDTNNIETTLTYGLKKNEFWTVPTICNGEPKTSDKDDSTYNLAEVDTSKLKIICPDSAKVLLKHKDAEAIEVDEVECKGRAWKWIGGPENVESEDLELYCIKTKYCTACPEPTAFPPQQCPTCKALEEKDENGCKVRKCPEDSFKIDGKEETKSPKGMTCEKKDGQSKWLIHDTDDHNVVDGKASCYIFKGCHPFPKLGCPEGVTCKKGPVFNQEIFNYTCPDADAVLQQNKKPVTPTCDKDSREWNGVDSTIDLYCADEKTESNEGSSPKTGGGSSGQTIGIVAGVLIGIGAAVGGVAYYFLIHKKKQDAKKTTKKEEGTSKKSSKKVESKESKSGGVGSSNEAKKEEKKSDPNKESEKPAAEGAKEAPKDGKEAPKEGAEPPKDAAATPAAAAATPGAPPGAAAPATPAADSAPAPADATPV